MELNTQEELTARAIGLAVMRYLKREETAREIARETEAEAVKILEEIRSTLDDLTLDDPACFRRIEAILGVLEEHGMDAPRHDW